MTTLLRIVGVLLALPAASYAAVCSSSYETREEEWKGLAASSTYVVVATVGATEREASGEPDVHSYLVATLEPIEVLKGRPPSATLRMRLAQDRVADSSTWGGPFAWQGDRVLLFLNKWSVTEQDFALGCRPGSTVIGDVDSHDRAMQSIAELREHLGSES